MTRDDRGRTRRNGGDDGSPERVDFSALRSGPGVQDAPDRWEALARRIDAAAAPELARRASRAGRAAPAGGVLFAIARAARPALLAAAASVAFAIAAMQSASGSGAPADAADAAVPTETSFAQALLDDEPAASWIAQQREPSADDLARAIDPEAAQ